MPASILAPNGPAEPTRRINAPVAETGIGAIECFPYQS